MIELYVYIKRNKCDIVRDRNQKKMHAFRKTHTVTKTNIGTLLLL